MPASHEIPFKIFYSWQSDLPNAVNLKLIRNALNQAATAMNADHDLNLHVVVDEATREVPGSPDIADSIFTKIKVADVFVCDLTKVAQLPNAAGELRKYCNPNAALELGYAVRVLGWNRIIIVFNIGYGVVPDDLPFDARGHRVSTYRCAMEADERGRPNEACSSQIRNATGGLRVILEEALKLIARENPKRPQELEVVAPEVIRRERDMKQLKSAFRFIHLPTIDGFIDGLSNGCIRFDGQDLFQSLASLVRSSSFHIAEPVLAALLEAFVSAWGECFKYVDVMDLHPNGTQAYFRMPGDFPVSVEQGQYFDFTAKQWKPLRAAIDALLAHVRQNYLEIDPSQTGLEAVQDYQAREMETRELMKVR